MSWYGPGLYGNKLSCGGRLTPGTLGVAHKTLPCGARVTLRRGDRVIRVRVVDRGPYVGGREFDLTSATRAKPALRRRRLAARRQLTPPASRHGARRTLGRLETQPPEHPRRVIAHLDCDSFYASVELQRRPELRGQPVVVAGSGPRAVVTTASYEARRFGVHSAMSAVRARRLCPHAIFVTPDFNAYREKSREVWAIVRERLDCPMQNMSVDEAYADVTAIEKPLRALRDLVAEVRERTGITISVGVGPSRLVAKTASDAEKPAGFVVLSREQACERFAGEPTRLLQGVGPRTAGAPGRARPQRRWATCRRPTPTSSWPASASAWGAG